MGQFLNISTRESEWQQVIATADRESDVWASVGIHPHEADQHADMGTETLLKASAHPRVIGIGETGLDYYYDNSDRATQRNLFRMHIGVARETMLPLIIHTRDAEEDTLRILEEELGKGAFPALKEIPQENLLVETDSPFLAPVPHRGRPCEPAFVADTASFVASLRSEEPEELAAYTTRNFSRLFSKAKF